MTNILFHGLMTYSINYKVHNYFTKYACCLATINCELGKLISQKQHFGQDISIFNSLSCLSGLQTPQYPLYILWIESSNHSCINLWLCLLITFFYIHGQKLSIPTICKLYCRLSKIASYMLNYLNMIFCLTSVAFIGHVIKCEGIKVNGQKIEAVITCPISLNPTEVRNLLGLSWY